MRNNLVLWMVVGDSDYEGPMLVKYKPECNSSGTIFVSEKEAYSPGEIPVLKQFGLPTGSVVRVEVRILVKKGGREE